MRDYIEVIFILTYIRVRWIYFHLSPRYFKFYADDECTEAHFQNLKHGTIHSQLIVKFKEDSPFYKEEGPK